jgi:hypothetical protein
MTFEELLDQAIAMLQRRGRVTYRAPQHQFALDEDILADLKVELLYAHPQVRDDAGQELLWMSEPVPAPVEVFELTGASYLRRRLQVAAACGLTRFLGRQAELTVLQQALAQAGAGRGQMVAMVGEPGVGKSRLVYEFLHALRDRTGGET